MNNNNNVNTNPNLINQIKQRYLRGNNIKIFFATLFTALLIMGSLGYIFFTFNTSTNSGTTTEIIEIPLLPAVPEQPNANVGYVIDNAHKLNSETIKYINELNSNLYTSIGAEIYVVIENGDKNTSAEKKADEFFNKYNVSNNGVVVYYSIPHDYGISVGTDIYSGVERNINTIFSDSVENYFSTGNYNDSVILLVESLYVFYETNYNIHINSSPAAPYSLQSEPANTVYIANVDYNLGGIIRIALIILFIIVLVSVFSKRRQPRHYRNVYYTPRSGFWGGFGLGLFSGGIFRHHHHHMPRMHGGMKFKAPPPKAPPRPNNSSWGRPSGKSSSSGSFGRSSSFKSSGRGSSGGSFGRSGRGSSGGSFGRKK